MASPGWAQSVAPSFGADSWAGWWRVTSGSWRSSGCEVSRADARQVFPAPGLFHAPEEARREGVKLQPGADPQKGDGRWMAWRSLVGFVRNRHALLRGCELQPSARLEAGEQPGRPLPPHEYEGHAAGMAVGRGARSRQGCRSLVTRRELRLGKDGTHAGKRRCRDALWLSEDKRQPRL